MDYNGQLTFDDDPSAAQFKSAVNHLRLGHFEEADSIFHQILAEHPEHDGVANGIKAARFWQNRQEQLKECRSELDKGRFLKQEWNKFEQFLGDTATDSELPILAVRVYIFTEAIHNFTRAYRHAASPDLDLIYDIGECYFNIRDYGKAVETFEYAWEFRRDNSRVLARLADAYYALGENPETRKKAKLLFREAFLHNPDEIDLERIRALMVRNLLQQTEKAGHSGTTVARWLPVFAAIEHQFNIKRELEEDEAVQLADQAYRLEQKLNAKRREAESLLPLLLNRYIWLIDHYMLEQNDTIKVNMLHKKFQQYAPEIFEKIYHN